MPASPTWAVLARMARASRSTRRTRSRLRPPDPGGESIRTRRASLARRGRGVAHRARPGDQEPALAGRLLADRPRRRRGRSALRALGARGLLRAVRAAGLGVAAHIARDRLPDDRALRPLAPARRRAVRTAARRLRRHPAEALDRALGDDPVALPAVGGRRGHDARLERRDPSLACGP